MRIDLQKLDERIYKLQEIRRIAADPELAAILLEFMTTAETDLEPVRVSKPDDVSTPRVDSTHALVNDVVTGISSDGRDGLWSRRRS